MESSKSNQLNEQARAMGFDSLLGRHIFLDRYALKEKEVPKSVRGRKVVVHFAGPPVRSEIATVVQRISGGPQDVFEVEFENGDLVKHVTTDGIDFLAETTPAEMWDRLAKAATVEEKPEIRGEIQRQFRDALQDFKFVPAGRILTGLGANTNQGLFNCFVLAGFKDSREGIIERLGQMVGLMSAGGGVGINLSSLRPKFSVVRGVNGRSSGSVSWGDGFSFFTGLISQGGSRRGAGMQILECWHPDIEEFIDAKRDQKRLTNTNVSVGVTDKFMAAVDLDQQWNLVFPDTSTAEYENWNGDIKNYKGKIITYKTIKARDLWDKICLAAHASAEPGLWFVDRANHWSNSWYYKAGRLIGTNPCQPGWATVATPEGIRLIDDIRIGDIIWQGCWKKVTNKQMTGTKTVYAYRTTAGTFYGTDNHRIVSNGEKIEVDQADSIDICQPALTGFGEKLDTQDVVDGLVFGDGTAKIFSQERNQKYNRVLLCVGEKDEEDYRLDDVSNWIGGRYGRDDHREITTTMTLEEMVRIPVREVPDRFRFGSPDKMRGFLRGLYSANGSVIGGRVSLKMTCKKALEVVQEMLSFLGMASYYTTNPPKVVEFKNGAYQCKQSYDLNIGSKAGRMRFYQLIGFIHLEKQRKLSETLDKKEATKPAKVTFDIVEKEEISIEPVYSLTVEDEAHTYWTGGMLVANCGEQSLPGNGVCCLGHINLSKFWILGGFSWGQLKKTVRAAVRFLDNMIDINHYQIPAMETQQKGERRIGLGTLGLADLLVRMKLRYGSPECLEFLDKLYGFILEHAYLASSDLAAEKGSFLFYHRDNFLRSQFMKTVPENVFRAVQEKGMRNVTCLTQAPTGTVGTMVGTVGTGIEPFFELEFWRQSRMGKHLERAKVWQEWLDANESGVKPDYFATAMELSPEEHLSVMAKIQKYTDSSISKTVNVPNDWKVNQVSNLYLAMYGMGCKGGTIYRDGCREEQVLSKVEIQDTKKEEKVEIESGKTGLTFVDTGTSIHNFELPKPASPAVSVLPVGPIVAARPDKRVGVTISKATPVGTAHITVNEHAGEPFEVFVDIGKGGSDLKAMAEAVGRLCSLLLRLRSDVAPRDRIIEVVGQLRGIGGGQSVGLGPNRIKSLPDAVAIVLEEIYLNQPREQIVQPEQEKFWQGFETETEADLCPSCGDAGFVRQGGCTSCRSCGHSVC